KKANATDIDHQSTMTWSQGRPALDVREPLYLQEFLEGDSWDLMFRDGDGDAAHYFSDGLRDWQEFCLNDFVRCMDEKELLAEKWIPKLQPALEVCRATLLRALNCIDEHQAFVDSYTWKKQAAEAAAKKIMDVKRGAEAMERRQKVTEQWLAAEIGKLDGKEKELHETAVASASVAGAQLQKFMKHLDRLGAYSATFEDAMEVWLQKDAAQRAAREIVMKKTDDGPSSPSLQNRFREIELQDTLVDVGLAEAYGCLQLDDSANMDNQSSEQEPTKLGQCNQDSSLPLQLSVDGYKGNQLEAAENNKGTDDEPKQGPSELGQCDDQGSSLPQQVSVDGYNGDQHETDDKKMQDPTGVGQCDQDSPLPHPVSVDGYKGDQQETEDNKMQDPAGVGQCDHDSSLPHPVSVDGYEGDQQETDDKKMQDSAGVGQCDQDSSLPHPVSVDGYEGDQQETDDKKMQDPAGVGQCDQDPSLPHPVSVDGYEGDQQETDEKKMQDSVGVGQCDQASSLPHPVSVDGYVSDTDS
ncbi:unnamed protein product, partial [Symbiodinium sp. CCMP2592]